MDDNARPHRSRAVTAYLQSEAVTSVPWLAMSLDLNPIEHIWDHCRKPTIDSDTFLYPSPVGQIACKHSYS
jgi:transposase